MFYLNISEIFFVSLLNYTHTHTYYFLSCCSYQSDFMLILLVLFKACVVQPKAEMDLQFESTKLSTPLGYISAIVLCVTTFGTIALTSGFFLKPGATFDDYIADVVPLFAGFITILGVSEVCYSLHFHQNLLYILCYCMIQRLSCFLACTFNLSYFVWINNSL